jgi:hypothetical protein
MVCLNGEKWYVISSCKSMESRVKSIADKDKHIT